jgi:hypothetical protein
MRVLNLDLDFFLNDRVNSRADDPNNRPDDHGLKPWRVLQVRKYLKESLNLNRKTPGAIVQSLSSHSSRQISASRREDSMANHIIVRIGITEQE